MHALARTLALSATLLAALTAVPPPARATLRQVVGVSPDGRELAVIAVELDPTRGFHRHFLVRRALDGAGPVSDRRPLVADARHAALAARGDYDLLRYERRRARRAALEQWRDAGFRSCRALQLRPADGGIVAQLDGRALELDVVREGDRLQVWLAPDGAERRRLGEVTLPADALPLPAGRAAGVRDVFVCGAARTLVAVLETADPPEMERPPRQFLVVGPGPPPPTSTESR